MKYYIKERLNPQLGRYWVACGQRTKESVKKTERTLYGNNIMHGFDGEKAYEERLAELREQGECVQ